jgi:hypothetical protein
VTARGLVSKLKKVKERSVQQAQFLCSNHRVVLPWRTQVMAFVAFPGTMLKVRASMVHLQSTISSATCCGKNAETAEKLSHFSICF